METRQNNLLSIFFLIVVGVAIGYGVLMDPLSGAVVAGGIITLLLAIVFPWSILSLLLAFTPFKVLWTERGISAVEVAYSLTFLLLVGCWIVYSLANMVMDRKTRGVGSPLLPPLILFFVAALFSTFIAITKGRPFEAWGSHLNLISFYAIYFVVVGYLRSLKDLNKVFIVLFIVTTIAVIRGIFYNVFFEPQSVYLAGSVVPKIARASSAGLVIFMIVIPLAILIKDRWLKIFYSLAAIFFGIQQALSFVRSRWIGCITGIVFLFLVLSPAKRMKFIKYSIVILLLVIIYIQICSMFPYDHFLFKLPSLVEERFATILRPSEEVTALTRFSEWRAVIKKIKEHPVIGNGLGSQISYVRYDIMKKPIDTSGYIHNSCLFYYLNTGILGLFAVLWMTIAFVFYGLNVYRTIEEDYYKAFVLGCITAFVALSVASLMGAGLVFPGITIVIGFLMGAVTLVDKLKSQK